MLRYTTKDIIQRAEQLSDLDEDNRCPKVMLDNGNWLFGE